MKIRRLLPFTLLLALLALPVLASAALAAPSGKEIQVSVVDYQFQPKSITVNAGDTVVWTNNGKATHTVTASDQSWDSGRLEPGKTFSHTFDTAGTVPYYCKPHGSPDGNGMAGTVVVLAAGAAPAAAPAQAPQASAQPAPAQQPAQTSAGGNSVDASDQSLQNGSVTVSMVMAATDGWLVVHANTPDNKPGDVLGETAVKAGENTNVQVALNPAPKPGDKVWPMLHIDAPQKGKYEFPGQDVPVVENGNIVMKQITILPSSGTGQPATAPRALPNTGENDPVGSWPLALGMGAALILAGALLRTRAARRRRS